MNNQEYQEATDGFNQCQSQTSGKADNTLAHSRHLRRRHSRVLVEHVPPPSSGNHTLYVDGEALLDIDSQTLS